MMMHDDFVNVMHFYGFSIVPKPDPKFSKEKHIEEYFKEDDTKFWRKLDFSIVDNDDVKCWKCGSNISIIKYEGPTYSQFSYRCKPYCNEDLIACCKCGHTFPDDGNGILKGMTECLCHNLPFCMYCRLDTECTDIPELVDYPYCDKNGVEIN